MNQSGGGETFPSILLNKKNKKEAACLLKSLCRTLKDAKSENVQNEEIDEKLKCVDDLMWKLLNPDDVVSDFQNIEWCKWLLAGGEHPDEYGKQVREFDDAVLCGLVWTPNFIAYRCRTCSYTPSMSLCADCFLSGNHEGHDFNMFRSQAGGACDCGDLQVMKESGFCIRHGPNAKKSKSKPPAELVCVAEFVMPYIVRRLLIHFRRQFSLARSMESICIASDDLLNLLQTHSDFGAAMKETICSFLLDPQLYKRLFICELNSNSKSAILLECLTLYKNALDSLTSISSKDDADVLDCPDLCAELHHETLLDELVFWLVRLEFPQKLVTFVLSFLPCENYKKALLDSFSLHYTRVVDLLSRADPANETISHRVIHISVQLLSNDALATYLVKERKFLRILVASLYNMIKRCLVECTLHTKTDNFHLVANCRNHIMEGHNYWVLASDLHNLVSHAEVALLFLRDPTLLDLWCDLISAFQGMNVNVRELESHIEYESRAFYAAFTAEIEICSSTTWHLLHHLNDSSSYDCILAMLQNTTCQIQEWFEAIQFQPHSCWKPPLLECCFHLPLHRLYAAFLCQGIKLGMQIPFPSETFLRQLVMHPLIIQICRSEINCNMWIRNGTSMRYQSCLYVQSHFSCAFSDLDIYLLQVCATKINPDWFILTLFERYHLADFFSFSPIQPVKHFLRSEWEMPLLESALRLAATMVTNTINLGSTEEECTTLEIATLLCQGDKTHSQILDMLPDKGSPHSWPRNFEQILRDLADYKAPQFEPGGTMSEGIYVPKAIVWEKYFDPLFVMLRSVQIRDFQMAMDRYVEYCKKNGLGDGKKSFWPPYRLPSPTAHAYESLKRLLHCKSLHSIIYVVLFKAVNESSPISDEAVGLAVYLLQLALNFPAQGAAISETSSSSRHTVIDMQFCGWFPGNCILTNMCHKIDRILYIDNIPGLSRSCQDETNQGDFPDLIRLRAKLAGAAVTPTAENSLVPSGLPRSRSADIPYIDSIETESEAESDYFYNKAMAYLPPGLRLQYFLTGTDLPALTMEEEGASDEVSTSSSDKMALAVRSNRDIALCDQQDDEMDVTGGQPALGHDKRLAIEGPSSESSQAETSIALVSMNSVVLSMKDDFMEFLDDELSRGLPKSEEMKQLPSTPSPPHALPQPKVYVTNAGETLLSLLLKLHNKYNPSNCYKPPEPEATTSDAIAAGDGAHFIGKVLDRAYFLSEVCCEMIESLCRETKSPPKETQTQKDSLKESRKNAAIERQRRLMSQFTAKQKKVFEQFVQQEGGEASASVDGEGVDETKTEKTFECVICNLTASLSMDNPIGLVAFTQATSVLSKEKANDAGKSFNRELFERATLSKLSQKFDSVSSVLSTNCGYAGGVYVQTCGHYVHCECQETYMKAVRTDANQIQTSFLQMDKGEFFCPLCRQYSNCVLPLVPSTMVVENGATNVGLTESCEEIMRLLEESTEFPFEGTSLEKVCDEFVKHLELTTFPQFKIYLSLDFDGMFCFLCGVLRTNFELVSLLIEKKFYQSRSSCVGHLFKLLANSSVYSSEFYHNVVWSRLTGADVSNQIDVIANRDSEVPLLFQDPTALLLRFALVLFRKSTLPSHFTALFHSVFVLHVVQICTQLVQEIDLDILRRLTSEYNSKKSCDEIATLRDVWQFVSEQFLADKKLILVNEESFSESSRDEFAIDEIVTKLMDADQDDVSFSKELRRPRERHLQNSDSKIELVEKSSKDVESASAYPSPSKTQLTTWAEIDAAILAKTSSFLKIASVLKHCIFDCPLPMLTTFGSDTNALARFVGITFDREEVPVRFPNNGLLKRWMSEARTACFDNAHEIYQMNFPTYVWSTPRLINLPDNFDVIFRKYHQMQCKNCKKAPKEMLLCLACADTICYRDTCCKSGGMAEIETHMIDCGAGNGVFLSVHSSLVFVTREKRASHWGSLYLDVHGEEDRGLKRGKPLYLSVERLALLERQWLSHSFDTVCKRWHWLHQNPNTGSVIIL